MDFEDKSRALLPSLEKLAKNDVKIKIALSGDLDKIKKINAKHGLKARQVDTNNRMFISDRTQALLMITPENAEEEMGVWLNSEFFTDSLHNIIEKSMRN
jgi:sugar-specific transcriptional regulator TrmB